MRHLWRWLFGKPCEHEWRDKDTFEHSVKRDGEKIIVGYTYTKECAKCHVIWTQRV